MSGLHGKFCWHELMAADLDVAEAFYRDVVGWQTADAGMGGGMRYTLCSIGKAAVAGMMVMPDPMRAARMPPHWLGYIWADDVDATASRVIEAGGAVHRAAEDIPGVGRFAVVGDPQGAIFVLFKGIDPQAERPTVGAPGTVGWNELYATEWAGAFAFYANLFGSQKADAVDMGPMGTYQLFGDGGMPMGGMMTKPPFIPKPVWTFYFNTDDIDAAVARVAGRGGRITHGPVSVPGGSWIIQCVDPQGAVFAMVGARP